MFVPSTQVKPRLTLDAGIAIGPILFIIAVLGILAAAIAAGSGSFTTGTTGESNRARASAIIDMGQNLKIGFERITGNGIDFAAVDLDPTHTVEDNDLFSPTGGGIMAPSRTMAATPSTDDWGYPLLVISGIGTTAGQRVATLRVTKGVCLEINSKTLALDPATDTALAEGTGVDLGDFADETTKQTPAWPASFEGKPIGCVYNDTGGADEGYYFYQVIGIQ